MKLLKDFGVTALLTTIITVFGMVIISMLVAFHMVEGQDVLIAISSWIGAIVSATTIIKSTKNTDIGSK